MNPFMRPGRGPRALLLRRLLGALGVFVLVTALMSVSAAASDTQSQLDSARAKLDRLTSAIDSQNARLQGLESDLNAISARIDVATGKFQQTKQAVDRTRVQLHAVRDRYRTLRSRLDSRVRNAYMEGVAGSLELILSAHSIADFSDRVEYVNAVSQQDADLASAVQNVANVLKARRHNLESLLTRQAAQINVYNSVRADLRARYAAIDRVRKSLASKKEQLESLTSRLENKLAAERLAAAQAAARRAAQATQPVSGPVTAPAPVTPSGPGPFRTCPVGDPHGFSDSFGAPRYAGGYHPHAGNDIMAPGGTPIYAPFDGVASADPNGLGGNAVIVRGSEGWVYNAHLSSYGTLGSVSAGTVIGYVGNTGDAQGGPTHDHFEWHPDVMPATPYVSSYGYSVIGDAIDPYPYLLQVC
jgi:peptidoglycan hydrolase CwlO-like protein